MLAQSTQLPALAAVQAVRYSLLLQRLDSTEVQSRAEHQVLELVLAELELEELVQPVP